MLNHTPKEISERKALVVNPAKTCQPIGAMYAALGIHGCLPHSHGSQGCCSYHRMHLTRHYRDPIMASTSSFTEGTAVFGGRSNLEQSIKNVFSIYNPDIIAINTTCLSETIGDDIGSIVRDMDIPEGKYVIHANTPSYVGSHITGFSNMVRAMVNYLAQGKAGEDNFINIIPGFVEPADMREIKRIAKLMGVPFVMYPDTSGVVDAPLTGRHEMYPKGGTKIADIERSGNAAATLALGRFASAEGAYALEKKCGVTPYILQTPIGIEATDAFIMQMIKLTGNSVPYELEEERGQLVDIMTDTHFHFHGKKVSIFGDPDIVISMTQFALSLGMEPVHILTGTPGDYFVKKIKKLTDAAGISPRIKASGDLMELHQWIKNEPVNLIIGNTYGKYISKAENIPLVRIGFPVLDRTVQTYLPITGYRGAMRIIEKISGALLDQQDMNAADEDLELVM